MNDFPGYLFPSVLSVEKQGSLISLEEEIVSLGNPISPVPGAISDGVLISELIKGITGKEVKAYVGKIGPLERKIPKELAAPRIEIDEEFPFTLIGVGLPYHHSSGGITRMTEWNKERGGPYLLMNPSQYKEIGLGNKVRVVTPYSNIEILVGNLRESPYEISKDVLVVPAHYMECRNLFPFEADSDGIVSPGAVKAKIEQ
jgi:anaerobic selenocysteine-containing dehydrogenase